MSSPSDVFVNFPADEDLSRSLLEDKENVVTSVSAVQEIVHVEEVLVQDVSVVEIVGTGATAVSDVGSGVVTAPEDGVSLVEVGADVGTGVDNTPSVSDIAYSELADMQSADIAAAIEPVSVLEVVPAAAAAAESAVSLEEDDDHRVLTSEALPTKEDITFVDPSIVPESLPFEEIPPDDTIPLHAMADPSIAADVLAAAEDDERTAQEVQKAEELGAVTAEIVKYDEKKEEQEATVVRVVEESVSVLQTRVIVEEVVPSTGEVLAQNVTESTIVDRETMTETALPQAAAGIVDACAIAFTGEKEETMAVEETAVKKRSRDEIFVSEEARALAEQLPVAAADAVDEALALAVAGEEGDVPAVKRVKSDAAAGGEVEADVEQNNGSSKAVDDTQMGEEHTGDVEQGGGADSLQQEEAGKEEEQMPAAELKLGPKLFLSSIELFSYLYDLLHGWVVNTDLNKYEFLVVSELLKEGAPHKVGAGISAIQVRMHPSWKSRCYYLIRSDGSVDDFSYRKCVEKLLPLPKSLFLPNGELDLDKVVPGAKGRNRDKENGSFDGAAKGRGGGRGGWVGRGFQGVRGGRGGRGGHGKGGRWT